MTEWIPEAFDQGEKKPKTNLRNLRLPTGVEDTLRREAEITTDATGKKMGYLTQAIHVLEHWAKVMDEPKGLAMRKKKAAARKKAREQGKSKKKPAKAKKT